MQRQVIDRFDARELDMKAAQLEIEHFWAGALRRAVIDGDIDSGSVMAGQSVGMVSKEQPTAAIIQEMIEEAISALVDRRGRAER
jgi:enoyl-[acyl-carrier protein] reductase II